MDEEGNQGRKGRRRPLPTPGVAGGRTCDGDPSWRWWGGDPSCGGHPSWRCEQGDVLTGLGRIAPSSPTPPWPACCEGGGQLWRQDEDGNGERDGYGYGDGNGNGDRDGYGDGNGNGDEDAPGTGAWTAGRRSEAEGGSVRAERSGRRSWEGYGPRRIAASRPAGGLSPMSGIRRCSRPLVLLLRWGLLGDKWLAGEESRSPFRWHNYCSFMFSDLFIFLEKLTAHWEIAWCKISRK